MSENKVGGVQEYDRIWPERACCDDVVSRPRSLVSPVPFGWGRDERRSR